MLAHGRVEHLSVGHSLLVNFAQQLRLAAHCFEAVGAVGVSQSAGLLGLLGETGL